MKRNKVIVYVTVSSKYAKDVAILAEERENGWIAVPGHQLHVVADPDARPFINKESLYYMYKTDYKRKCYDCFRPNDRLLRYEPMMKKDFILRCSGYHPTTGSPGFTIEEAVKAGVPEWKAKMYKSPKTGLLHIRMSGLVAA